MADSNEESLSETQKREENARIYKAFQDLRRSRVRAGASSQNKEFRLLSSSETRTWGTVQFEYPSEQSEARIHAALKPFLYVNSDGTVHEKIGKALFQLGILPVKMDGVPLKDVFAARGAVDGVQSVQIFVEGGRLTEYLLIS